MLGRRKERLRAALDASDEGVRFAAADALERLESALGLDQIIAVMLEDPRPAIRREAARALGQLEI